MKKNECIFLEWKITGLQKVLRIMRLTVFLLLLSVISVFADKSYSQNKVLNLNMKNSTVKEVLRNIEKQSEFVFMYSEKLIDVNREVSLNVKNRKINEVLDELFAGTNVNYKVRDRFILLTTPEVYETDLMVQQQPAVSGTVTDESRQPLPGVTVLVKGSTRGTVTNSDGNYRLTNIPEDATLQFSFVGMQTQEVEVDDQSKIDVTMVVDALGIEEVVAIGYGTQRKVNLTGSVVSTSGDDIIKSQSPNVANSLTGRLPGVIINSRSGEPGRDDPSIYIRGRSTTGDASPLVIIDGVERTGLSQLNPNDIENVTVLKDASAAIYGARAANGVILVTTKAGKLGKPTIEFTINQAFSQPTRNAKMADSYKFATVMNEIDFSQGRDPRYTEAEIQKFKDGSDPNYPNTDWYDYMVKEFTPQRQTNLSLSGGTNAFLYFVSLGELNQDGQFKNGTTNYKRYNLRSNIEANVTEGIKVGLNLSARFDDKHYPRWDMFSLYSNIFLYHPDWQPFWPGTDKLTPNRGSDNVINWVSDDAGWRDQKNKQMNLSFFYRVEIPWVKGLWIDGSANYDAGYWHNKLWYKPTYVYYKDTEDGSLNRGNSGMGPFAPELNEDMSENSILTLNTKINYAQKFGDHNVNIMVAYEQMQGNFANFSASRRNFISIALPILSAGSTDKNDWTNSGSESETARLNYFGRASYDYNGKYLAQFILRYDGSVNFPENKRFGLFPGISFGWRLSEEEFMDGFENLNNLKIRGSYGEMGNDKVAAFQYLNTYSFDSYWYPMVIGNTEVAGVVPSGVPNPNITWEVAKTGNIGLETTWWKGLLGTEIDFFRTRRENILTTASAVVPDYTGLQLPDENIGIVENKGFELKLSHINNSHLLKYSFSGNFSFSRNKVIFNNEAPAAEPYQLSTGRPMGAPLVYKAIGIFKDQAEVDRYPHLAGAQPGDIKYEDVNGDEEINSRDRIRINQTPIPEIVYGLTSALKYKNFDLSLLFQGQANATIFPGGHMAVLSSSFGNFLEWRAKDRWTPQNTVAKMPRSSQEDSNYNTYSSTHWGLNAAFLRFKNMELGYNLPSKLSNDLKVQNLRLYVSGENLLIIKDHMKDLGFDPETTTYWYYPQQRIFNVGLKLTF